jgi:hypothetical protein
LAALIAPDTSIDGIVVAGGATDGGLTLIDGGVGGVKFIGGILIVGLYGDPKPDANVPVVGTALPLLVISPIGELKVGCGIAGVGGGAPAAESRF